MEAIVDRYRRAFLYMRRVGPPAIDKTGLGVAVAMSEILDELQADKKLQSVTVNV